MRRRTFIRNVAAASALAPLGTVGACGVPGTAPTLRHRDGRAPSAQRLDTDWRFVRGDVQGAHSAHFDDSAWQDAILPHTARIEALVTGEPGTATYQWQGTCWYRRRLRIPADFAGRKLFLKFEAAMNVADVWLDGHPIGHHDGGFLPFVLDVSDRLAPGVESVLAVRLDNRDNPVTGPKPLAILDFNTYHGLYRYVHLIDRDRLHITDALFADRPASGGVLITCPQASPEAAQLRVQTHVRNDYETAQTFRVRSTLHDPEGAVLAETMSAPVTLRAGTDADVVQPLDVVRPPLWSPHSPALCTVATEIVRDGRVVDMARTRFGIRRIQITRAGFRINGERMFLRGTNRHQEHPYVGYAVPAAAHYRDAQRIKDAGFDYIRLSHYPHAPAFMDACDELGLLVMNCIPGWQYFGDDPAFAELQYRNCRDLIRRDRNRPSVLLWEVSLNETAMPPEFIARTHAIAHEELPGDQCYTCGWMPGYDVFIRARQHGGCRGDAPAPCVVSEYGDWEYYAMTAGLDQHDWQALAPDDSNSRQLRWHGEQAQLQQAANFQEAHDDNRGGDSFADGLWVMFDYNRGYAPDIESSGCMDIFRLPKYARHFFRSQRPPHERLPHAESGPMVFVASEWTPASSTSVRVFSNCDEVELRLNGTTLARRSPDQDHMSRNLAHPPFTFTVPAFTPGRLEAIGYIAGREAARHTVRTPGAVERLHLQVDIAGRPPATTASELLFCHGELRDAHGTTVAAAWENVAFGTTGDVALVGRNPFSSDAGIATILARTHPHATSAAVFALAIIRADGAARIVTASAGVIGDAPRFEARYTTDGSAPGPESPRVTGPVAAAALRAAVLVDDTVVALLDERAEKFRVQGSTAPETREPFRHP